MVPSARAFGGSVIVRYVPCPIQLAATAENYGEVGQWA